SPDSYRTTLHRFPSRTTSRGPHKDLLEPTTIGV
ncbi:hypothetical protein L917_02216, partial [Phytophthora nicotianae]